MLFDVFHANEINSFQIGIPNYDDSFKAVEVKYPDNYTFAFNFDIWSNLQIKEKILLFYWWFKDECKKQNIINCDFCFIGYKNSAEKFVSFGAYLNGPYHSFVRINPKFINHPSYILLSTISHELNHCSFKSKEYDDYLRKIFSKIKCYWSPDKSDDYFYQIYSYLIYFFQPIEFEAHKYGFDAALKLFNEITQNKIVNFNDTKAIQYIKRKRMDQRILKNIIFQDDFNDHLDLIYLQFAFELDAEKIKNNDKLTQADKNEQLKKIDKDIQGTEVLIQNDLLKFRKRFLDYINSNKVYDIKKEMELDFD